MTRRPVIGIPIGWERRGLVLGGEEGGPGGFVIGDPCIVYDEEAARWRMFLFALPPGHGHAVCSGDPSDPRRWRFEGPLVFANPQALGTSGCFKPFVVLDAHHPNRAARIAGLFALLFVCDHEAKVVRRAWSRHLAGPWTIEDGVLIARGSGDDFDARHVDAVSAYLFGDRDEIVYFYMGYPMHAQARRSSVLGSAQGVAVERMSSAVACAGRTMTSARAGDAAAPAAPAPGSSVRKLGEMLPPSDRAGHWASGWVGGLQLLPGTGHRWIGLLNASPTAPRADDDSLWREEPPPSLGGFAWCDEPCPTNGWTLCDQPVEWPENAPPEARAAGETMNFWRHHAVVLEDGRLALFYNAGEYFREKLFLKVSAAKVTD